DFVVGHVEIEVIVGAGHCARPQIGQPRGVAPTYKMNLQGKKILVLGLGTAGIGVARFALRREAQVIGVDDAPRTLLKPEAERLSQKGAQIFSGDETHMIPWEKLDRVILSPGVPLSHPLVLEAKRREVAVMGEIEFASRFNRSPVIGITGTNGKSTTTELIGALLQEAGFQVSVGGNLGTPWVALLERDPTPDWTVLELSSFQLETIESF